jgi:hypothetical protein
MAPQQKVTRTVQDIKNSWYEDDKNMKKRCLENYLRAAAMVNYSQELLKRLEEDCVVKRQNLKKAQIDFVISFNGLQWTDLGKRSLTDREDHDDDDEENESEEAGEEEMSSNFRERMIHNLERIGTWTI